MIIGQCEELPEPFRGCGFEGGYSPEEFRASSERAMNVSTI
jgi:hypothetical protein